VIERLRRWLLAPVARRLRAWAGRVLGEDGIAAAAPAAGGPPAHWLEHIRRRRPELVAGLTGAAPLFEARTAGVRTAEPRPPAAPGPAGAPAAETRPREARSPRPGPPETRWGKTPFRRRVAAAPAPAARRSPSLAASRPAAGARTSLPGPELQPSPTAAETSPDADPGAAPAEVPPRRRRGPRFAGRLLAERSPAAQVPAAPSPAAPSPAAPSPAAPSPAAPSPAAPSPSPRPPAERLPAAAPAVGDHGGLTASFAADPRRAAMPEGRWPQRPAARAAAPRPPAAAERLEPPPRDAAPPSWPAPAGELWPSLPKSPPAPAVEPAAPARAERARRLRREQEGKAWNG
jgi:hypothetical protein